MAKSPRVYTYKITFEEIPDWYWGVHKESKYGEEYFGSPVTNKWKWEFYTPKKQILEVFPFSEEGWQTANLVEDRLIGPDLNNPLCLNESCGPKSSLRVRSRAGKIGGATTTKRKAGVLGRTPEQMTEDGRKGGTLGGATCKREGKGIFSMAPDERKAASSRGGETMVNRNRANKTGLHGLSSEELSENGKKGSKKVHSVKDETGRSLAAVQAAESTHKIKNEEGKSINAVKCGLATSRVKYYDPDHPELGVHRACNLSYMQKSRGYPNGPENRVKLEKEDSNG
jgi:hypothetical protein